jgi:urease accessory protein
MYEFTAKTDDQSALPITTLTLPLDQRKRSRQRVVLDNGEEAALLLPRGTSLLDDDRLVSTDGIVIKVKAAREPLSRVASRDTLLLCRACYHLGNRHMPVQISQFSLLYPSDHVLDDMIRSMGLKVTQVSAPFEPETGAFNGVVKHSHGR